MDLTTLTWRGLFFSQGQEAEAFFLFFSFLFYISLFLRDRVRVGEGQRERETQVWKQAPGSARGSGLEPTDREIMT